MFESFIFKKKLKIYFNYNFCKFAEIINIINYHKFVVGLSHTFTRVFSRFVLHVQMFDIFGNTLSSSYCFPSVIVIV